MSVEIYNTRLARFEIDASMGTSTDPWAYLLFYLGRLRGAANRDEVTALVDAWPADLRNSTATLLMAAAFALYGDTRPALDLKSRQSQAEPAGVPLIRFADEEYQAVLASVQGRFDEAEQHLATMTSVVRDHAMPRGEVACLIGFAKVALDRDDYARASRLLAAVTFSVAPGDRPFRSFMDALIYARCTEVLRDVLDTETTRTTQAEGATLSLKEALDAELMGTGTMPMADPAD